MKKKGNKNVKVVLLWALALFVGGYIIYVFFA